MSVRKRWHKLRWYNQVGIIVAGSVVVGVLGGGAFAQFGPSLTQNSTTGVNLQKGLVGWWKLDGNGADSTVYRNRATLTGTTSTTDREGKASGALSFGGTGSVSMNSAINGLSNFSMGVWFYPTSTSTSVADGLIGNTNQPRITWGNSSTAGAAVVQFLDGKPGGGNAITIQSVTLPLNKWHHAMVTVSNANSTSAQATFYVDGTSLGTSSPGVPITLPQSALFLNTRDGGHYFNGSMDDARIYNRAISTAEVKALYQQYDPAIKLASGESQLVGWWKMDGNAADSTPYRNLGTIIGGVTSTTDRKNKATSALQFNGTTGNISVPNSSSLSPTGAITVSAWVNSAIVPSSVGGIVTKNISGSLTQPPYVLQTSSSGKLQFGVTNAANSFTTATSATNPSANTWYYVVGTFNGSSIKLYVNNVLVGSTAQTDVASSTGTLTIGQQKIGANSFFNGAIDDVRIYSRALSATEIASQYASYNSQINANSYASKVNLSTGLVGYWPFNGNANDLTPFRATGTVAGPTLIADRNGRANSAYYFDGSNTANNQTIRINNISTSNKQLNLLGNMTESAWIKPSSTYFDTSEAVLRNGQGADLTYSLFYTATTKAVSYSTYANGGFVGYGTASNTVPLDQWSLVTITRSGTTITIFVNGVSVGSGSIALPTAPTLSMAIGRTDNVSVPQDFTGAIDDVRIYNRALSTAEVAQLYTEYR